MPTLLVSGKHPSLLSQAPPFPRAPPLAELAPDLTWSWPPALQKELRGPPRTQCQQEQQKGRASLPLPQDLRYLHLPVGTIPVTGSPSRVAGRINKGMSEKCCWLPGRKVLPVCPPRWQEEGPHGGTQARSQAQTSLSLLWIEGSPQ